MIEKIKQYINNPPYKELVNKEGLIFTFKKIIVNYDEVIVIFDFEGDGVEVIINKYGEITNDLTTYYTFDNENLKKINAIIKYYQEFIKIFE